MNHDPLYVVTARHSTGHGPMTSVVLVISSPIGAVNCARNTPKMAYEFNPGDGVTVSKILPGVVYDHKPGDRLRFHTDPTNADAQVFTMWKNSDGTWTEFVKDANDG